MQRLIFTFLIIFSLLITSSCDQSKNNIRENSEDQTDRSTEEHTAMNSLDWKGVYKGMVPCADCVGIEAVLELKEPNSYTLKLKYLGNDSTYTSEGIFLWHDDGMRISLEDESNSATSYMVGENQVFLLDKEGAKITGDQKEYYVLLKQ